MKKIVVAFSLLLILTLGACSATTSQTKTATKETNLKEVVVIDGIQFTVKELETIPIIKVADKKNQELFGFEISGKNISYQKSAGFGASDFVALTSDGKEHPVDDSIAYFGDSIEPNKTLSGTIYFSLDKNQKIEKLQYKVDGKAVYSWTIK